MLALTRNRVQLRRITCGLLILWPSFLLLESPRPCCDIINAAIASDHAALHNSGHHHDHAGHHRDPISEHVHCEKVEDYIGVSVLQAAEQPSPSQPFITTVGAEDFLLYPAVTTLFRARHRTERLPPIYLTTLRLRI